MTTIVGIKRNKEILLGADSLFTKAPGFANRRSTHPKLHRISKNFIIGMGGYPYWHQKILPIIKFFKTKEVIGNDFKHLLSFTSIITTELDGIRQTQHPQERFEMLIGYNNNLYIMEYNAQIIPIKDNYTVIGTGEPFALGALYHMFQNPSYSNNYIIREALNTACYFDMASGKPYKFMSIPLINKKKGNKKNVKSRK